MEVHHGVAATRVPSGAEALFLRAPFSAGLMVRVAHHKSPALRREPKFCVRREAAGTARRAQALLISARLGSAP